MAQLQENSTIAIMCTKCNHVMQASIVLGHLSGQIYDFTKNVVIPFIMQMYLLDKQMALNNSLYDKRNISQVISKGALGLLAGLANQQKIICPFCDKYETWEISKPIEKE